MSSHGVDAVLVVNVVGDTGVQERYVGTVTNTTSSTTSSYSGTSSGNAMVMGNMIYGTGTTSGTGITHGTGMSSGTATTTSTPVYHYSRAVAFEARLSDPQTSRKFWVGSGQTKAGGSLFMGDATSAADAASSIFNDLQTKGLIGAAGA